MEWYEILVIVLAVLFVVAVLVWRIVRRVQGKGGCDCESGCTHCEGCPVCAKRKEEQHAHTSQSP